MNADITVAYKRGKLPETAKDIKVLIKNNNDFVTDIKVSGFVDEEVDFSLDVFVLKRETLISWISSAVLKSSVSLSHDVFIPKLNSIKMYAYKVDGFAQVIDNTDEYVKVSKMLLDGNVRKELFNTDRPVYTKTRDDMPTRYAIGAVTENSLIGNGCIINGTVKNSILFRGVKVEKGAVVDNCILMQGTQIGENAVVKHIVADKGAKVNRDVNIKGTKEKNIFIGKGKEI